MGEHVVWQFQRNKGNNFVHTDPINMKCNIRHDFHGTLDPFLTTVACAVSQVLGPRQAFYPTRATRLRLSQHLGVYPPVELDLHNLLLLLCLLCPQFH